MTQDAQLGIQGLPQGKMRVQANTSGLAGRKITRAFSGSKNQTNQDFA
jgi:hypothetical protein